MLGKYRKHIADVWVEKEDKHFSRIINEEIDKLWFPLKVHLLLPENNNFAMPADDLGRRVVADAGSKADYHSIAIYMPPYYQLSMQRHYIRHELGHLRLNQLKSIMPDFIVKFLEQNSEQLADFYANYL